MTEALIPAPSQISLTRDEVRRYSRHLIIPDIGVNGQQRLKDARVLCIGAGGLGSPALLYLAAAGVGTIGIIDGDHVDESNLQRQIIHGTSDVGRPKVESAAESGGGNQPARPGDAISRNAHPRQRTGNFWRSRPHC
ncbi:molybdenum cofactor biosynthesis protein moeB2 [Mycobacterium tuberculosis T17]|nr:molybdenum cofactor biosynthesis protein moeB2 [Mycobacterium tuberculosis T17]